MKTKLLKLIVIVAIVSFGLMACDILGGGSGSSSTDPIGGIPTPIGEVGNTFTVPAISGTSNRSIKVIESAGGNSVIEYKATVTNPALLRIANHFEGITVNGNEVSGTMKFRITSKGVQSYTTTGKPFTLVEYDAKKGDKYVLKRNGPDLVRKVVHKSSNDDFYWGSMMIKTIQVEETGIKSPGVSKVKYYFNHRFGMVGMDVFFEDGSTILMWVFSDNDN